MTSTYSQTRIYQIGCSATFRSRTCPSSTSVYRRTTQRCRCQRTTSLLHCIRPDERATSYAARERTSPARPRLLKYARYALSRPLTFCFTQIMIFSMRIRLQMAMQKGVHTVRVVVRGLGAGRLAAIKGLEMGGLTVVSITDATRISNQHPRPRKVRRV